MLVRVRFLVVAALLAVLVGCTPGPPPTISLDTGSSPTTAPVTSQPQTTNTPRPTREATTEPTVEVTVEPTRAPVVRVPASGAVDPCALVSQDEVTEILGGYEEPTYNPDTALCLFASGSGRSQQSFWIGVGNGSAGKQTLFALVENIVSTLNSSQATVALDGAEGQIQDTTMVDLVRLFAIIQNMTPMEMTELDAPGDSAYYFWLDDFDGLPLAEFLAVDGDKYVVMVFIGSGMTPETTQEMGAYLADDILAQLPATFTVVADR